MKSYSVSFSAYTISWLTACNGMNGGPHGGDMSTSKFTGTLSVSIFGESVHI